MEEKHPSDSGLARLCRLGCGFYGSPLNDGLCSRCYATTSNDENASTLCDTTTTQSALDPPHTLHDDTPSAQIDDSSQELSFMCPVAFNAVDFSACPSAAPSLSTDSIMPPSSVADDSASLSGLSLRSLPSLVPPFLPDESSLPLPTDDEFVIPPKYVCATAPTFNMTPPFSHLLQAWDSDNASVISSCSTTGATVGSTCSASLINGSVGNGAERGSSYLDLSTATQPVNAASTSHLVPLPTTPTSLLYAPLIGSGLSTESCSTEGPPSTMGALTRSSSATSLLSTASTSTGVALSSQNFGEKVTVSTLDNIIPSSVNTSTTATSSTISSLGDTSASPPSKRTKLQQTPVLLQLSSSSSQDAEQESMIRVSSSTSLSSDVASVSSGQLSDSDAPKKRKNRCSFCSKRVGLLGFECRCGGLFCTTHRYSNSHNCTFDYRQSGRDDIRRSNPQIISGKIQPI